VKYLESAKEFANHLIEHFWDEQNNNFFMTADNHIACNAGLEPKLTMMVAGIVSDESLKRKELGKFEYR